MNNNNNNKTLADQKIMSEKTDFNTPKKTLISDQNLVMVKTLADEKVNFEKNDFNTPKKALISDQKLFEINANWLKSEFNKKNLISDQNLISKSNSEMVKTLADQKNNFEKKDFNTPNKNLISDKKLLEINANWSKSKINAPKKPLISDQNLVLKSNSEKKDFNTPNKTLIFDQKLLEINAKWLSWGKNNSNKSEKKSNGFKLCENNNNLNGSNDRDSAMMDTKNNSNGSSWAENKLNESKWGGNGSNDGDSAMVDTKNNSNWSSWAENKWNESKWGGNGSNDGDSAMVYTKNNLSWSTRGENKWNGFSKGWAENNNSNGSNGGDSAMVYTKNNSNGSSWGGNSLNGWSLLSENKSNGSPLGGNNLNGSSWGGNSLNDGASDMVGAGLSNLGNTCFLNAILQCFTHTVPLIEGLRLHNHPKPCERDSEGFCVFCALHSHIELAISGKEKRIFPMKIVENLNKLSCDFRRYQQEDAHELLQSLLDKLDTCCKNLETDGSDESLVRQLFGGRLVSKLKCCNCGHSSDTFESLVDLSLEIENMSSLPVALESFTRVEKIEDEEPQFTCESCKEKVTVEKQLMLDHAPLIAAFHLKRFKNDGSCVQKIDTHVEFPLELDLNPYTTGCLDHDVDLDYSLYAVVEHSGFSPTSGHYFCFVRTSPDVWYRLDDSQVTRVSETQVLSRDAYILLYAKKGTTWFSSFQETEKLAMGSSALRTSPKSVLPNAKQNPQSPPTVEANFINEVSEEDTKEASSICGLSLSHSGCQDETGEVKTDPKLLKKCTFIDSIRRKSLVHNPVPVSESSPIMESNISRDAKAEDKVEIGGARLSFEDCIFEDEVDRANDEDQLLKKQSLSEERADVGKRADVNSSTIPGLVYSAKSHSIPMTEREFPSKTQLSNDRQRKEACKLVKGMSGSKRRSQLLAVVNSNHEPLNDKKVKISQPSPNMKDGTSNARLNPNLASVRRHVASERS